MGFHENGTWPRAAWIASAVLLFSLLAIAGVQGKRRAMRRAKLDIVLDDRERLQKALDEERSTSCVAGQALAPTPTRLPAVTEWTARLEAQIADFRSEYARAPGSGEIDLQLPEAALALAQRRFEDAERMLARVEEHEGKDPGSSDRDAEIARARADADFDRGAWTVALERYRLLLHLDPEDLTLLERVADCLCHLGQIDGAARAYADLANRLQDRGNESMSRFDYESAMQDFKGAATKRGWLLRQGRQDVTADLARSFAASGAALVASRFPDYARAHFENAIRMQTLLTRQNARSDLAHELAVNHARLAALLSGSGKPGEAIAHFGSSIDLLRKLVDQGQGDLGRELATSLARRGLVHESLGQADPAAWDFEETAKALAAAGDVAEAIRWQTRALDLAPAGRKDEIRSRLESYRSGPRDPPSN